jgi:hypothetical protein
MTTKKTWTDEEFVLAVKNNITIVDTLKQLGLTVGGANYKQTHLHIERLKLDTSHWKGRGHGKNNHLLIPRTRIPTENILIENSTYVSTSKLKKRLLKEGLLINECAICGIGPEWKGYLLVMVLDHENGISNDNRLSNLRLLCPNCNSQQPTFCRAKTNRFSRYCPDCGTKISSQSKTGYCVVCVKQHQKIENQYTKKR